MQNLVDVHNDKLIFHARGMVTSHISINYFTKKTMSLSMSKIKFKEKFKKVKIDI